MTILFTVTACEVADREYPQTEVDPTVESYFSDDYAEARIKFLDAALSTRASLSTYQNTAAEGLFTDVASLNTEGAEFLLVIASGTHGIEGFAGSAIQNGLLRSGVLDDLPPKVGVVLVHAINPYGFTQLRRTDEQNIDVNRNFVDHSQPCPLNDGYAALEDIIAPPVLSVWEDTKAKITIWRFRMLHGKRALQHAVSAGQYAFRHGLFFGGNEASWSNQSFHQIVADHFSHSRQLILLDIHTGLGPFGNAQIISNESPTSSSFKRATQIWGEDFDVASTIDDVGYSVQLSATLKSALPRMIPDTRVTAVTLELGTYSSADVFWALRKENWAHHHSPTDHPLFLAAKAELKESFYPNSATWRRQVWNHGYHAVRLGLETLTRAIGTSATNR